MPHLSIALLGRVQVHLDGQPTRAFTYNKARALLAHLAVEADRPHGRDERVGLLWPELPDAGARTNLRQALAGLRDVAAFTTRLELCTRPHRTLPGLRGTCVTSGGSVSQRFTGTVLCLRRRCAWSSMEQF
jgi:DNA-binding SARP family transcriptional activator